MSKLISIPLVQTETLSFLKDLDKNNNRDWFNQNKETYMQAQENMLAFVDALLGEMNKHDVIETQSAKKSLYRIYNDVRFSKDKSPYAARFAFRFARATKLRRGGYYVHLQPGKSFLACGYFNPNAEDLKTIRMDMDYNHEDWFKLLKTKSIKTNFGELQGNKVETTPRGFDKAHPAIDLIRHKQFILRRDFTDKEVLAPNFMLEINTLFKSLRPFLDYTSEVLTTNSNGELLV
ncbi:MAG: DUF2461 domain-containing protein [Bacteroidia bacterium]|nr:DUF2461 domain-containing protein [Bacteroidia bacterium]MCF8448186.1 DUF2461 domain-containing protein [Bacteroidia bacterium]